MKCPKCNAEIPDKAIAAHLAAKGGAKSSVGKSAAERTAKAKAAAKARWSKQPARRMVEAREKKRIPMGVEVDAKGNPVAYPAPTVAEAFKNHGDPKPAREKKKGER